MAIRRSCGRQSYALLRSKRTVPTTPDLSKVFCQFFSRFKRVCCIEWPLLKPHNFGDNIFSGHFSIYSKRTLSNIFEIIGNELIGYNTVMTSATSNSSGKYFIEMHLLIQFVIGTKTSFLANLIMAGDISPLELSLRSISFMYIKIMFAETNSNLKLKDFLNLSFIVLILG